MSLRGLLLNLLWLYWLVLMARLVLSYVVMLARDWRPRGVVLVLVEGVYTLTDPPLRALRKVIPPLRLGGMALDLAFMVLFLIVIVLMQVVARV
ncbi:YggT family protein [Arsenicicoccus cauae]|uniref:YggT family protein n=1 Tax=Arsenicicoccus cauae TaxID=2663847 RepID=UPI00370DB7B1